MGNGCPYRTYIVLDPDRMIGSLGVSPPLMFSLLPLNRGKSAKLLHRKKSGAKQRKSPLAALGFFSMGKLLALQGIGIVLIEVLVGVRPSNNLSDHLQCVSDN